MQTRLLRPCFLLFALSLIPSLVFGTTRHVRQDGSGDFTTIGAAVTAASAGDVIEVGPGIYNEQVDVYVKLSFVSTAGANATIMDGMDTFYTLWFRAGTGHEVDGFTFRNGYHISGGGAIRCQAGATLTLKNSILEANASGHDGGAIFTRDTGSFIDAYDCEFRNNYAEHNGAAGIAILDSRINYTRCKFLNQTCGEQNAGASCDHSAMDVRNCLFVGNSSASFAGAYYYFSTGVVEQNTFYGNTAGEWSTVLIHDSDVDVTRNIIANTTGGWGLVYLGLGSTGEHTCNVYYQNENGPMPAPLHPSEIVADPQFCHPASGNFMLSTLSPAAPSHNSCNTLIGAYPVGCGLVSVAISTFDAVPRDGIVELRATFSSAGTIDAVNVYRAEGDGTMEKIASLPGTNGEPFEYADKTVRPGKDYRYQLGVRDVDGEFMSQVQRVHVKALVNGLDQNRPNPFNPTTTISYTLASAERVTLAVYDTAGRLVCTLVDGPQAAGTRDATWDGRDDRGNTVASGVYFYKLHAGKFSQTRRMVMLK